jgi:hypothetical protein
MNLAVGVDICVAIKTHPEYNPHQTVYYCYNMLLAVKWLWISLYNRKAFSVRDDSYGTESSTYMDNA